MIDRILTCYHGRKLASATLSFLLFIHISSPLIAEEHDAFLRPEIVQPPADNQLTPARAELGKNLFFDPRLSGSNWISCATCHNPALNWTDGLPKSLGVNMKVLKRATPTILNSAYNDSFTWDGRSRTLEEQALGPITSEDEMDLDIATLVKRLSKIPDYKAMFDSAYPGEGITKQSISRALASFERTVITPDAPFDKWRKGDETAVNDSVKRGFKIFTGKANCDACHQDFNFTDNGFHNIGLKTLKGDKPDYGRYEIKKFPILKGRFKTPTLRNAELTAPYMHNGAYNTLMEVIDHYDRGGDVKDNLDPEMSELDLSESEKHDLLNFMKSLTSNLNPTTIPQLPL